MKLSEVEMISRVANICKRCLEVSFGTEADVFFNYSPHTQQIDIAVHIDGWTHEGEVEKNWTFFIQDECEFKVMFDYFDTLEEYSAGKKNLKDDKDELDKKREEMCK